VPTIGKKPVASGWDHQRLSESDLREYLSLPQTTGVAVALHRAPFIDVEVDSSEGEKLMLGLFNGRIPQTPTWRSPRGLHRLFKRPAGLPADWHKVVIGDVEFRGTGSAKGALSLFPPSVTDGFRREWLPGLGLDVEPADLPGDVVVRVHEEGVRAAGGAVRNRGSDDAPPVKLDVTAFTALRARFPALRPAVVDGIARQGETVNIIGGTKVGKSWLGYGLLLSIANGVKWLDRFATRKGRVLLIDNELHPETIVSRVGQVAEAMTVSTDGVDVVSLRGQAADYRGLAKAVDALADREYVAILADAHYRMLPPGTSENENAAMTAVYNLVDQMAERTGAAWFLVHHTSKGEQADKRTTDVGAGAGSQSRAADTHLVIRSHTDKQTKTTTYLMTAAVRSFPPMPPVSLRYGHPVWATDPEFTPERAETVMEDLRRNANRTKVFKALQSLGGMRSRNDIANAAGGMNPARCQPLLDQLVAEGKVTRGRISRSGNQTAGYEVVSTR
jgi:hypothetical protein